MAPENQKPLTYYLYRLLAITIPALLLYLQTTREARIKADVVREQARLEAESVREKSRLGYETLATTVNDLKKAKEIDEKDIAELQGYCKALGELHHRSGPSKPIVEMSTPILPKLATPAPKPMVKAVPLRFDAL